MVRKKPAAEPIKKSVPIYPISVAAKLLDIHPRTLRIYEDAGLLKPERKGNRRLYSANDITWVGCLRKMIHSDGISIPGIQKLLRYATCYEISDCPEKINCNCDAVVDRAIPKSLRIAGDAVAEKRAKQLDTALRKEQQGAEEQQPGDRKVR
ncbi:MerR family transcriptional regulator [Desulforhopalus sp. 52FAK]